MTFVFLRLALSLALAALVAAQMLHMHRAVDFKKPSLDNHPGVDPLPPQSPTGFHPTRTTKTTSHHHDRRSKLHSRQDQGAQSGTNAQRFAAGLPPLKPRNLLTPSKVRRSPSSASPSPSAGLSARSKRSLGSTTRTGFVRVVDAPSQKSLGYVSRSFTTDGQYLVSQDFDEALEVTFDHPASVGSELSHIKVTIPQDDNYPLFGLIAASTNGVPINELGNVGHNHACLGMTANQYTPSSRTLLTNQVTTNVKHGSGEFESAIWTFEPFSKSLRPTWINPDGSKAEAMDLHYSHANGTLCLFGHGVGPVDNQSVELRLAFDA